MSGQVSWRENTPQQVQDDLDSLVTRAFAVVGDLLAEHRDFYPFAVTADAAGDHAVVMVDLADDETPVPTALLADLVDSLRAQHREIRAAATVTSVDVGGEDAVCVQFEHHDGGPGLLVLRKYTQTRHGHVVTWGDSQTQTAPKRVWA